jgi:hypothetical protein
MWQRRKPLITLVSNLSYRSNTRMDRKAYADFMRQQGHKQEVAHEVSGNRQAR